MNLYLQSTKHFGRYTLLVHISIILIGRISLKLLDFQLINDLFCTV